jgi:dihydrolipoamide dehydrogenase
LASAHAAEAARQADRLGIHAEVTVDFPAVMERVQKVVKPTRKGVKEGLDEAGVHTVNAEATLVGQHQVKGGDVVVEAPIIVINTGKSPFIPDIPGMQGTPYMTYENFWEMRQLPPRILVIGAGYTGLELSQGMARLGSKPYVVEIMERSVADEELEVSAALEKSLEVDGVEFYFGKQVSEIAHEEGIFRMTLDDGQRLEGEALLIAAGRVPNTKALGLEEWNVSLDDKGHIVVDEQLESTAEGIYAIGDVTGQPAFTHISWEDHRRLLAILNGKEREQRDRVLGYAFFTDPQVGRAGLSLEEALKLNYNAEAVTIDMDQVTRATIEDRKLGFFGMVVDKDTDKILGATLVGQNAAELIHVFIAHIAAGATWQLLEQSVYIHPTYAEELPSLARKLKGS